MKQIDFSQTEFILSANLPNQWLSDTGGEVAFAGRSNVGKSSALNTITNRRGLARTSKTPGRTQHIVFFQVADKQRLVDLPGYGFAKTPISVRKHWQETVTNYLSHRGSLRGLILPMDIRRPFTELDQQMVEWTVEIGLPIHVLLTKADKLSRGKAQSVLLQVQKDWMGEGDDAIGSVQLFSATKRIGLDEARNKVSEWLAIREES